MNEIYWTWKLYYRNNNNKKRFNTVEILETGVGLLFCGFPKLETFKIWQISSKHLELLPNAFISTWNMIWMLCCVVIAVRERTRLLANVFLSCTLHTLIFKGGDGYGLILSVDDSITCCHNNTYYNNEFITRHVVPVKGFTHLLRTIQNHTLIFACTDACTHLWCVNRLQRFFENQRKTIVFCLGQSPSIVPTFLMARTRVKTNTGKPMKRLQANKTQTILRRFYSGHR